MSIYKMSKTTLEDKLTEKIIKIGNVAIEKTAALAPMASVADRAYREICKKYGASYTVSEMISSKGLCYGDNKTKELCTVTDEQRPMALQIFGEDPYFMGEAAKRLRRAPPCRRAAREERAAAGRPISDRP